MTMRAQKGMAAGLAGVLAVALTGAVVVSPANAETASQPVVALLMQNPAPGDGGVAAATVALPDNPPRGINHVQGAGGWYDVVVEISPGDTVDGNTAASDRAMTLTFSAGVRVVRVEQRLVGKDPVDLPLPGADRTVTDVAKAVPITQAASWGATLEVTTMSTGVDLTTTATAGMTGAKGTIALAR